MILGLFDFGIVIVLVLLTGFFALSEMALVYSKKSAPEAGSGRAPAWREISPRCWKMNTKNTRSTGETWITCWEWFIPLTC